MTEEKQLPILLVEDNPILAVVQAEILRAGGWMPIVAHDGAGALETMRAGGDIALVLMDIDLGQGPNGFETARSILAEFDVPIVFLSGHLASEVIETAVSISPYGYVRKGTEDEALIPAIRAALDVFARRNGSSPPVDGGDPTDVAP